MPDCCIEEGWLQALRGLNCTPIPAASHFVDLRTGSESTPYVVVTVTQVPGLRTSDGVQVSYSARIVGYFEKDAFALRREWMELVMAFVTHSRCLALGQCGCFCVTSLSPMSSVISGSLLQASVTVSGRYLSAGGSGSGT